MARPHRRPMGIGLDLSIRHADGHEIPVEISLSPVEGKDGPLVVAVVRDISERRQLELERDRLEAQVVQTQKLDALGRLAGGIAHDFNNVLTAIRGYSEISLAGVGPESTQLRDDLEQIRAASDRAGGLTRQLIAFSRGQVLKPQPVDLNEIAVDVEQLLGRVLGANIEIVLALGDEPVVVEADPTQLEQVLVNLALNSRDAMAGGGTLRIETRAIVLEDAWGALESGSYALLTVSDTGTGMDAATLDHVFEPFFTTKEHGKGTGLGLATVHGIVRQSGGEIVVHSELGKGTAVRMYLPQAVTSDRLTPAPQAPEVAHTSPRTGSVLLAEDEDAVRALVERMLTREGFNVVAAAATDEAFALFAERTDRFDVLVTDLVMPGAPGHELARRVRMLRPDLKILFMSGYTMDALPPNANLGPDARFLEKPFSSAELLHELDELLA